MVAQTEMVGTVVMAARKRGPGKSGASLNGRMDGGEDAKQRRQHGDRLVIGLCLCFPTLHACLVDKVGFKVGMSFNNLNKSMLQI